MESRSSTALLEKWNLAIATGGFQLLQVFLWIKVLTNAAIKAFLDSSFQKSNFLFILLQPAKAGTNDLAGIVVSAAEDAVFDKLLIMRS